jgi:hypothetical protein
VSEDFERAIGPDRRTFVKRIVIGTAFAAPVVSSFTMSGVQAVFGSTIGPITGLSNSNTTPIPPANFTEELICSVVGKGGDLTIEADDGPVHITLLVPDGALPSDTIVCIYKGNLAALTGELPDGQTAVSAYGASWNPAIDASLPLVMTVTGAPVSIGDPIYLFDKATGTVVESSGTVLVPGTWTAEFTDDPGYAVAQGAADAADPVVAPATTTG